jgi:hypothetical protein
MSLPDGVTTCLLTYGPITDTFGNPADSITVEVVADRTIVHAASGRTMFKNPVTATATGAGSVQIPVPHTNQSGFRDQQQNALTGWYYTVNLSARFANGAVQTDTKTFQPVTGQTEVDADLLQSPGMVTPGSTAQTQYVPYPGGGTDGQALVKQGTAVVWGAGSGSTGATAPLPNIPWMEGIAAWIFGHSYLSEGGDQNTNQTYAHRVQRRIRTQVATNRAAAGATLAQILAQVQSNWAVNTTGVIHLAGLINNSNSSLPAATTREQMRSVFSYLTACAKIANNSTAFAYSSGWTSGATTTANSYVDFGWVGDGADVAVEFGTGAATSVTVTNSGSGSAAQTINTGGYATAFTGMIRLRGYGAGAHTVRIRLVSGAGLTVTGALIPSPSPPTIAWFREGPLPAYTTAQNTLLTQTYRDAIEPILTDFPTVVKVQYDSNFDPALHQNVDGVHLNTRGAEYVAGLVVTALKALAWRQGQNNLVGSDVGGNALAAPVYVGTTPSFSAGPAAPDAPTVTATPSPNQVALSWPAAADNGSAVTNYKVYAGNASGSLTLLTTLGNVLSYTETGLTNGTARYYRVSAVNANGEGPQSAEVTATPNAPTAPGAPQALSASPGNNQATLSWLAPSSNGGSAITDYIIQYRQTSTGGAWTTFSDAVTATIGVVVTGLTNGTGYDFQVAAVNAIGTGPFSAIATATPVTAFDPSTVSGLAGWYKADALTGISEGGDVNSFPDSSSAALTMTKTGTAWKYKTASGPNGKAYIESPTDPANFLQSGTVNNSPANGTAPSTYFFVMAVTGSGQQIPVAFPEGISMLTGYVANTVEAFSAPRQNVGVYTSGEWAVYEYVHTPNGQATGLKNGAVVSDVASGQAANSGTIKLAGSATNGTSVARIAEVLRYTNTVSSTNRTAIRNYLGQKYGVTIS